MKFNNYDFRLDRLLYGFNADIEKPCMKIT